MKPNEEEITFEELSSVKYMLKQSPKLTTVLIVLNILILIGAGYLVCGA